MATYRRVYESTIKAFAEKKKIARVSLIFLIFAYLASSGDITITGYSGDLTCAGTEDEPCYAYLNFTANTDIYIYPTNESTWAFQTEPSHLMKEIKMQRSWGDSWRTIDLSKTYNKNVKYSVKFSKGQEYELRFVGYKNNINDTVEWSFGDKTLLFTDDSYVDPKWSGYSKEDFMPELIMNEADIDGGIAVFKVCNPTSFSIPYNDKYVDFLFNKVKGNFDTFNKFYSVNYNATETNSVWMPNVTIKEIIDTNGTKYNLTTDNGKYVMSSAIVEKTMYVPFNSTIYYLKPKECKNVMLKATWKPETVYKEGILIDWMPNISISGVSYVKDIWAWWSVNYPYKRQHPISASVTEKVTVPCMINGTTGFNLGNRTQNVWTKCEYNSTDEYLYYQNSSYWAYVNETSNSQLKHDIEVNQSDLVLWQSYDASSAIDDIGKNDGTINGATYTTSGKYGGAYDFVTNDWISIPHAGYSTTGDYSTSMWVKTGTVPSGDEAIVGKWGGAGAYEWMIFLKGTGAGAQARQLLFYTGDNCAAGDDYFYTTATLSDNTWYHLVKVMNGTNHEAYIDGVKVTSIYSGKLTFDGTRAICNTPINLGRNDDGDTNYFNGTIDEFRIYKKALTQSEITELYYNNGTSLYQKDSNATGMWDDVSGLVDRWDMSGDGLTSKSTGTDATVTGATVVSGKFGNAYSFDGTNDNFNLGSYNLNKTQGTLSFWAKRNTDTDTQYIFSEGGAFHFDLNAVAGKYRVVLWDGAWKEIQIDSGNISTTQYTYVAIPYKDNQNASIYIDGTFVSSVAIGDFTEQGVYNTCIGAQYDCAAVYLNGSIDEFRVYNRFLTQNEILAEYNAGNVGTLGSVDCFSSGNPCGLVNTIYLNGTSANRYYELGDQINITATVNDTGGTGQLCLTIDHPGYGTNYSCVSNTTNNLNTTIYPALNTFNDSSTSQNHTANNVTGVIFNSKDGIQNGQMNLKGINASGTYYYLSDNEAIGKWNLNEGTGTTTTDSSGNGNSLTLTNAIWTTSGKFGNATSFDGSGDYVNSSYKTLYSSTLTTQAWIYPKSWGTAGGAKFVFDIEKSYQYFGSVYKGGTDYNCYWYGDTQYVQATTTVPPPLNQWTLITCTRNTTDNRARLYYNDTLMATSSSAVVDYTITDPRIIIGEDDALSAGYSFNGTIDEFSVYNRTLSQNEISQIYAFSNNYNAVYPTNLSIDIGNDGNLDYWIPYSTLQDVYGITNVFKTNVATKNLTFSNSGRNVSYIDLPCNIQAKSMTLNISGGNGSQSSNLVDSTYTSRQYTLTPDDSSQLLNFYLPKGSTVSSASFTISGSPVYTSTGTYLSGGETAHSGYRPPSCTPYATTLSGAYSGSVTMTSSVETSNGQGWCWYGQNGWAYLDFYGDSGLKATCHTEIPNSQCSDPLYNYVYGSSGLSCTATITDIQPSENVYVRIRVPSTTLDQTRKEISNSTCTGYFSGLSQYTTDNPSNVTVWYNSTSTTQEYNFTNELNSSVGNKDVSLSTTRMNSYLTNNCGTQNPCPVPYYLKVNNQGKINVSNVSISYINSISNITLDISSDGTLDGNISGSVIPNNKITIGTIGLNAINNYLSGTCVNRSLPILWSSETAGTLSTYALILNYSVNPISLNTTAMNNYLINKTGNVHIPVRYSADNWGILNTNTLNIPFYGDVNYTITANYTDGTTVASTASRIISIIWSNYNISYPSGVSYFQFFPKTVNSTNVTPYGQSSTIPFFNITGRQRDRSFDLYMRVNQSYPSTINLTVSNSSTKGTIILNTSWQKVINNLSVGSSNGNWFWADFFNVNNTALRYIRFFTETMSKCDLCV